MLIETVFYICTTVFLHGMPESEPYIIHLLHTENLSQYKIHS